MDTERLREIRLGLRESLLRSRFFDGDLDRLPILDLSPDSDLVRRPFAARSLDLERSRRDFRSLDSEIFMVDFLSTDFDLRRGDCDLLGEGDPLNYKIKCYIFIIVFSSYMY